MALAKSFGNYLEQDLALVHAEQERRNGTIYSPFKRVVNDLEMFNFIEIFMIFTVLNTEMNLQISWTKLEIACLITH